VAGQRLPSIRRGLESWDGLRKVWRDLTRKKLEQKEGKELESTIPPGWES